MRANPRETKIAAVEQPRQRQKGKTMSNQKKFDHTFEKIPEDEVVFVLRAQDCLAPAAIEHWAEVPAVRSRVKYGATVYTDAARSYGELALTHWHKAVDHAKRYAIGEVHTNGLENFWSLLKRSLGGTYIAVAPFHLFRYTAEQVFRFNNRTTNDAGRFQSAMRQTLGKRVTYRVLTGKEDAGFMGIR